MNNINNINSVRNSVREGLRKARLDVVAAQEEMERDIALVQHKLHIEQGRRQYLAQARESVTLWQIEASRLGMPIS